VIPTSRVKTVIEIAFEEAKRTGVSHVGTEHLLLGIVIEGQGIAAHVLNGLDITVEKVRAELESARREPRFADQMSEAFELMRSRLVQRMAARQPGASLPFHIFSKDAEQAFVFAQSVAVRTREALNTGHLLMGLLHIGNGRGAMVLGRLGVVMKEVKAAVDDVSEAGDVVTTPFPTQSVTNVILKACEETGDPAAAEVGTEHLL